MGSGSAGVGSGIHATTILALDRYEVFPRRRATEVAIPLHAVTLPGSRAGVKEKFDTPSALLDTASMEKPPRGYAQAVAQAVANTKALARAVATLVDLAAKLGLELKIDVESGGDPLVSVACHGEDVTAPGNPRFRHKVLMCEPEVRRLVVAARVLVDALNGEILPVPRERCDELADAVAWFEREVP